MFSIVGIVLIFAGVLTEKGKLDVFVQLAELVTICGAAIGNGLAANPMLVLKKMIGGLTGVIEGAPFSNQ
jgi:flagellar motor component MotA